MKFITQNLPTISLVLITLIGLSLTATIKQVAHGNCNGGNNSNPECRWVNIQGSSGWCVSGINSNGNLIQATCSDKAEMLWNVVKSGSNWMIQNKSGRMMDNSGQGSSNGNKVIGYTKNATAAQIWHINTLNGNYVQIKNVSVGRCFDDSGVKKAGQFYHIWDCSNSNQNQWFEFKIPTVAGTNGYVNLVTNTGLCVSDKTANVGLVQEKCGASNNLLWSFIPYTTGHIIVSKNGRIMDNGGQKTNNGNPTIGYSRNNTPAQIWSISSSKNGLAVQIRNVGANKCLDDTGAPSVGKQVYIWDCTITNANQYFYPKAYVAPVVVLPVVVAAPVAPVAPNVRPVPTPTPTSADNQDDALERNKNSRRKMRKGN